MLRPIHAMLAALAVAQVVRGEYARDLDAASFNASVSAGSGSDDAAAAGPLGRRAEAVRPESRKQAAHAA